MQTILSVAHSIRDNVARASGSRQAADCPTIVKKFVFHFDIEKSTSSLLSKRKGETTDTYMEAQRYVVGGF